MMKIKRMILLSMILLILAALPFSAFADVFTGNDDWKVTVTAAGKMESNFRSSDLEHIAQSLEPGDTAVFTVNLENANSQRTQWYMANTVLRSLEDGTAASGGAYEYLLEYFAPGSSEAQVLYYSGSVGGENPYSAEREGLHGATSALENYFMLDELKSGQKARVVLTMTLDGESQNNDYQDAMADLKLTFAADLVDDDIVLTGYRTNMLPYFILMFVSGAALLVIAAADLRRKKREESR